MSELNEPREPFPVHSRISWGAILGGAAVTFALYVVLNLLGVAIGFSVADATAEVATGAAIWAIGMFMVALFVGGWVASRFTLGEDAVEAVLYGAILWGVSLMLILGLFGVGFSALVGMSAYPAIDPVPISQARLAEIGSEAGLDGQQIARLQAAGRAQAPDQETVAAAAWWAFAGTLLTMVAAIAGTLLGAAGGTRRWMISERLTIRRGHPAAG
jgi:hypothetical protein